MRFFMKKSINTDETSTYLDDDIESLSDEIEKLEEKMEMDFAGIFDEYNLPDKFYLSMKDVENIRKGAWIDVINPNGSFLDFPLDKHDFMLSENGFFGDADGPALSGTHNDRWIKVIPDLGKEIKRIIAECEEHIKSKD